MRMTHGPISHVFVHIQQVADENSSKDALPDNGRQLILWCPKGDWECSDFGVLFLLQSQKSTPESWGDYPKSWVVTCGATVLLLSNVNAKVAASG